MSKKMSFVDTEAAREKVNQASNRIARSLSKKAALHGSVAKEKIAAGGRVALANLASAGVKLTRIQLYALEKVRSRYSDSDSEA